MLDEKWKFNPPKDIKAANDNKSPEDLRSEEVPPEVEEALRLVMSLPADIRQTVMADMRYFMFNKEPYIEYPSPQ